MKIPMRCYECVIFRQTCNNQKTPSDRYPVTYIRDPKKFGGCKCRVESPGNTKSPVQVRAFYSLLRAKLEVGMPLLGAFCDSIHQTRDDVWDRVLEETPERAKLAVALCKKGAKLGEDVDWRDCLDPGFVLTDGIVVSKTVDNLLKTGAQTCEVPETEPSGSELEEISQETEQGIEQVIHNVSPVGTTD